MDDDLERRIFVHLICWHLMGWSDKEILGSIIGNVKVGNLPFSAIKITKRMLINLSESYLPCYN